MYSQKAHTRIFTALSYLTALTASHMHTYTCTNVHTHHITYKHTPHTRVHLLPPWPHSAKNIQAFCSCVLSPHNPHPLCRTFSWQRLMISGVKWGSCLRKESLFHSACVVIWASSMAASAGLSHPLELSTSTHAWISRIACSTTIVYSVLDPPFVTQHIHTHLDQPDCLFKNNRVQCVRPTLCNSAHPHTPGSAGLPVQQQSCTVCQTHPL